MTKKNIPVPDIGTSDAVEVIEISVVVGDNVNVDDTLIVLESSKATMEIPSPCAGKVIDIDIKVGDTVSAGKSILTIESVDEKQEKIVDARRSEKIIGDTIDADEAVTTVSASAAAMEPSIAHAEDVPSSAVVKPVAIVDEDSPEVAAQVVAVATYQSGDDIYAGPATRKLAREMGITLSGIIGSGSKGRVQKEDIKNFVRNLMMGRGSVISAAGISSAPDIDFAQFGTVDILPLSKLQKLTAANMHRSWTNLPHVTQFDDVDITELESFRELLKAEAAERHVKLSPLPFIIKACAIALKAHPKLNASLHSDGEHMIFKQFVHIGLAVDTPAGLVVPVLRDVDKKPIWELAKTIAEIVQKARENKLKIADLQGGCFTISNLGVIGGTGFTPIINAPEVAILGVSRLAVKPVWDDRKFMPRKMLPLSLSYDHRAVNGADAGRFFASLNELLADVRRLIL